MTRLSVLSATVRTWPTEKNRKNHENARGIENHSSPCDDRDLWCGPYRGPIGILNHRDIDAEDGLKQNIEGLKKLLEQLGDKTALKTYPKS